MARKAAIALLALLLAAATAGAFAAPVVSVADMADAALLGLDPRDLPIIGVGPDAAAAGRAPTAPPLRGYANRRMLLSFEDFVSRYRPENQPVINYGVDRPYENFDATSPCNVPGIGCSGATSGIESANGA